MRKFGRTPGAEQRLPHKTSQLRNAANKEFDRRYSKVADDLPRPFRGILRKVLGINRKHAVCWGHASHVPTRNRLSEALAFRMVSDFDENRPMAFITLVHDGWRTPVRDAVIDLVEIRQRARDCLREIGFEGVGIIEFDVLVRPKSDERGHQILPHIHAYGYLDGDAKIRRERIRKLQGSKRLTSFNGAPTVVYKSLRTADDVMHAVCYALKLPLCVKRMVPKKGYPGHEKMRTHNRRQQHALLSVVETLSYLRQKDLVFSMGGHNRWLTDACEKIENSGAKRKPWFSRRKLSRLWSEVNQRNRFTGRRAISVRSRK